MYLVVKNKKIEIIELKGFWERVKGLKFVLDPIDYGVKFPKKKRSNTDFLVQKIDVILTDKNEKIVYLEENVATERKIRYKKGVYNTYFLPLGTASKFEIGDTLEFIYEKKKR